VSGVPLDLVAELVGASLAAWRLAGEATCTHDGAIVVDRTGNGRAIRIEPKLDDAMFRWLVTVDGRQRPAVSLLAVLRQVRAALDPDFAATRVRVSVASLLVPG
jgi:hypothetical protein